MMSIVYSGIVWSLLGVLLLTNTVKLSPTVHGMAQKAMAQKEATCQYLGKEFSLGDRVTEDACDRCFCTQHGIMCEYQAPCPDARCQDKVKVDCCYQCPNGPNCPYNGDHGSVLVPETGCKYSDDLVCYCYQDYRTSAMDTLCWPLLPVDSSPACNSTTI